MSEKAISKSSARLTRRFAAQWFTAQGLLLSRNFGGAPGWLAIVFSRANYAEAQELSVTVVTDVS